MSTSPVFAPAPVSPGFPAPKPSRRPDRGGFTDRPVIMPPREAMEGELQWNRYLGIRTHLGTDKFLLSAVEGTERLSQPFEFHLDLHSLDHRINPRAVIGQEVAFRIGPQSTARFFHGYVSQFTVGSADSDFRSYRAVVVPWIWFLGKTSDCRIFQDKTALEIVQEIFSDPEIAPQAKYFLNGLKEPGENRRPYCVQYRESDLAFVSRLLEDEGIFYYFKHSKDDPFGAHKLVLAGERYTANSTHVDYRPDAGQSNVPDGIFHWERSCRYITERMSFRDYDYHYPLNDLRAEENTIQRQGRTRVTWRGDRSGPAHAPGADGRLEHFEYPGGYDDYDEGNQRARLRMQEEEADQDTVRAESTCRWLAAGGRFVLEKYHEVLGYAGGGHMPEKERTFMVTAIHHHAREPVPLSSGGQAAAGSIYTNRFTCIPATVPYRPRRITPKPVVRGTQTATVTGLPASEIYTDGCGRVKVQFRWDRRGQSDERSSCWIRVAQLWAGRKWGTFFWPRRTDEVIVAFEEGDPDRPLIVGSVYNDNQKPPYPLPQHQTVSGIKTHSSPQDNGYNELRFEDRKDAEQIMIHAQRRMDQVVRGSLYETNGANREVCVGGEEGGDLNILAHHDLNEHVQGTKYSMVDQDVHRFVKGDLLEKFDKNHKVCVGETMMLSAIDLITETSGKISQKSTAVIIEGTGKVSVRGGEVNIEATHGLSLKVGGSFIHITPKAIEIKATKVLINSGGGASPAGHADPAEDFDLLEAIDAAAATTKLPGTGGGGGGGGGRRTHRSVTAAAHHARPYSSVPPARPTRFSPNDLGDPLECIEQLEARRDGAEMMQGAYQDCVDETDADGDPVNQSASDVEQCVNDEMEVPYGPPSDDNVYGPPYVDHCEPYRDAGDTANRQSREALREEILREVGRWDPDTGTYVPTDESEQALDNGRVWAYDNIEAHGAEIPVYDHQIEQLENEMDQME
jgi:type VI secretion system secreted protein VgrG